MSEGGLRKIAELHVLLEEAYPKHVRDFLQKHGSEIPGLTELLLLYKSRNQPTKEQLWNKQQLELVAKNMQAEPSQTSQQNPDPLQPQESPEAPELLAEQKKNGSGRRKQTSVIPFDVTNPTHRDWTP